MLHSRPAPACGSSHEHPPSPVGAPTAAGAPIRRCAHPCCSAGLANRSAACGFATAASCTLPLPAGHRGPARSGGALLVPAPLLDVGAVCRLHGRGRWRQCPPGVRQEQRVAVPRSGRGRAVCTGGCACPPPPPHTHNQPRHHRGSPPAFACRLVQLGVSRQDDASTRHARAPPPPLPLPGRLYVLPPQARPSAVRAAAGAHRLLLPLAHAAVPVHGLLDADTRVAGPGGSRTREALTLRRWPCRFAGRPNTSYAMHGAGQAPPPQPEPCLPAPALAASHACCSPPFACAQIACAASLAVMVQRYGPGMYEPSAPVSMPAPQPFAWAGLLAVLSERRMQQLLLGFLVRTLPALLLSCARLVLQQRPPASAAAAAGSSKRAAAQAAPPAQEPAGSSWGGEPARVATQPGSGRGAGRAAAAGAMPLADNPGQHIRLAALRTRGLALKPGACVVWGATQSSASPACLCCP